MTGLLVSVRSAQEAQEALAGGADIIDVKEPRRGPLGAADPRVWREVIEAVAGRATVSIVLGELATSPVERVAGIASGCCFAKIGLAGVLDLPDWKDGVFRVNRCLPAGVLLVPVAYADWRSAGAPPPEEVIGLAASLGALVVIDTFDKSAGSLLQLESWSTIRSWAEYARGMGVQTTLAGSLKAADMERVLAIQPEFIGVRGAVCVGGREQSLEARLVRELVELVHAGLAERGERAI